MLPEHNRSFHITKKSLKIEQSRSLTKALFHEVVERYLESLADQIASGEGVDIPSIGKIQVQREEGKGYVTSITAR
jgi:nucleoid DNA-binding protein